MTDHSAGTSGAAERRCHHPVTVTNRRRIGQKVEGAGAGDVLAPAATGGEQLVATLAEAQLQVGNEVQGCAGEDALATDDRCSGELNVGHGATCGVVFRHTESSYQNLSDRPRPDAHHTPEMR